MIDKIKFHVFQINECLLERLNQTKDILPECKFDYTEETMEPLKESTDCELNIYNLNN